MPFATARDIKQDILFRGSESQTGSGWDAKVMDYLNRVYRALANGASEFLPEYIEDWWWMRGRAVLTLLPAFNTGSVLLTSGSTAATLSTPPAYSLLGYRLRVTNQTDMFIVAAHTAGAAALTLDSPYTGTTDAAAAFTAMKVEYALDAAVTSLISPMQMFKGPDILGLTPERMDHLFPIRNLRMGIPSAFSVENEQLIRFNAGGRDDGSSIRVEYLYRPRVTDLEDSDTSIPLLPLQYRHLLSDMALALLMTDKNDDRALASAGSAKAGLVAMVKENRRRLAKISSELGTIRPRSGGYSYPIIRRTDDGVIVT